MRVGSEVGSDEVGRWEGGEESEEVGSEVRRKRWGVRW